MVHERAHSLSTVLRVPLIVGAAIVAFFLLCIASLPAQEADRSRLREPVYRINKDADAAAAEEDVARDDVARDDVARDDVARDDIADQPAERLAAKRDVVEAVAEAHPLDPAIAIARKALSNIEANVFDYQCTLVKRERVNGTLMDHEFMTCKIRHAGKRDGDQVPFSVYLRFRKPDAVAGREVIYVEGENGGKIIAHEGGLKGRFIPTVSLLPNSALAMRGNRYPITEIGIHTLTRRLIEKGVRDRKVGDCRVRMIDGAKVAGRVCTMLEVLHTEEKPEYDFHMARVFLDTELNVPIRYEAYGFPTRKGGSPPLLEEYTYMNLKLNVGLAPKDFDSENSKYNF